MFIAKISKGRTIKEFVLAALIAPTIFDMIFIDIFGSTAVKMELMPATKGILSKAISEDLSSSIYVMFSHYPLISVVAPLLLFVCFTFFVVSADSCTIVLGMLSSGGNEEPKTSMKILWGIAMAVSAGVLMAMGGLGALQTASIVGAFPFTIIMFFICYTTPKMLDDDFADEVAGLPLGTTAALAAAQINVRKPVFSLMNKRVIAGANLAPASFYFRGCTKCRSGGKLNRVFPMQGGPEMR